MKLQHYIHSAMPMVHQEIPFKPLSCNIFVMKLSTYYVCYIIMIGPGRVAQMVTCLATDACLTADPGVASSIPYFRRD